jgi:cytochrome b6-f complex iron-sulfur subunit
MADKKKMSVADMLAAARNADAGGAAPEEGSAAPAPAAEAAAEPATPALVGEAKPVKPAMGAGGGRPSVAEMMAMARGGAGGAAPAKKPAEKPAAAAPKATPAPKPAAAKAAPAAPAPDRDTGSVLSGGTKKEKAGPMSKAEAAAMPAAASAKVPAQPKIIVPPMPLKPDYAKPKAAAAKIVVAETDGVQRRDFLGIGFWLLGIVSTLWTLATVKFMFPNVLREPPSKFKVGFPDAFPAGQVQEKFKAQFGIWVVNTEYNGAPQIFALKSVCTHLGCTPNWLEAEQKYKCPCHGSGFYKDGINFEGPAPRPLERYAIRLADDGQIEVDKSRIFQEEMGQWADASCYIPV